jgi:hypothetical protein
MIREGDRVEMTDERRRGWYLRGLHDRPATVVDVDWDRDAAWVLHDGKDGFVRWFLSSLQPERLVHPLPTVHPAIRAGIRDLTNRALFDYLDDINAAFPFRSGVLQALSLRRLLIDEKRRRGLAGIEAITR